MADYSSAEDSLSAKGLLLALILLGLFVLALAFFGGGNETPGAVGTGLEDTSAVLPAGETVPQTITDPQN